MPGIYIVTHPRAASTALERSFMTHDSLECFHEPFGDPFYFGPERMSDRFKGKEISESEYKDTTYHDVVQSMLEAEKAGKSIFLKDMAQYIIPPEGHVAAEKKIPGVAPSFSPATVNGTLAPTEDEVNFDNPTVIPATFLERFHYIVLIRPPHMAVPSYLTQCKHPRSETTGFHFFNPQEMGYRELRIFFEYISSRKNNINAPIVIDAQDLIRNPEGVMKHICKHINVEYSDSLLSWDPNNPEIAKKFEKWNGWHDDVLKSSCFKANKSVSSEFTVDYEAWRKEWSQKFDDEEIEIIEKTVRSNLDDYIYLRSKKVNVD